MRTGAIYAKLLRGCLAVAFLLLAAPAFSQNFNFKYENMPVSEVMDSITVRSGYVFVYGDGLEETLSRKISVEAENDSLDVVLSKVFTPVGIVYTVGEGRVSLVLPLPEIKDTATVKTVESVPDGHIAGTRKPEQKVHGKIVDGNGLPVTGAVVVVSGTDVYVNSDTDGEFSIAASVGNVLEITSIGFRSEDIRIRNMKPLTVTLSDDVEALEGVVITGYQKISKERATGSYSTVGATQLELKPVADLSKALAGTVPGMTSDNSGKFTIRGVGHIGSYGDSDPLVVVDGFPVQSYQSGTSPFEMVNPQDVESVTVLKDAAATSIYGARAANGVIVITTKRSHGTERVNVDLEARVSVSNRYDLKHYYNFADGASQLQYINTLEKYSSMFNNIDPYATPSNPYSSMPELTQLVYEYKRAGHLTEEQYRNSLAGLMSREGRWLDEYNRYFFRHAVRQQYNLGINGSTEKNNYRFSFIYNRTDGSSIGDTEDRFMVNLADTYKIIRNLSLSVNASFNYRKSVDNGISPSSTRAYTTPFTSLFNEDGSYANIISSGTIYHPIYQEKYEGKTPASWAYNPLLDRKEHNNESLLMGTRVQASLDYKPVKTLNISLKGQFEMLERKKTEETFAGSYTIRDYVNVFSKLDETTGKYVTTFPEGGMIKMTGFSTTSYNLRAQIDYSEVYAGKHELTLMAMGEMSSSLKEFNPEYVAYGYNKHTHLTQTLPDYINKYDTIFGTQKKYPFYGLGKLSSLADRYLSAGFNMAYSYDGRYAVSGSVRADASNFVSDRMANRFSPFWSAGLLWNIDKEKFAMRASCIDYLKIRASYGIAGIAAGKRNISTLTTIMTKPGDLDYTNNEPYAVVNIKGNPSLTWEKARTVNAGTEFSFFKGKLFGSAEYYNRYSYDVIAEATVPFIVNSSNSMVYNNAAILNQGVEVVLGSRFYITSRITWNGELNFAYNKNVVKDYNVKASKPGGQYVEGLPLSPAWGYRLSGYTESGLLKLQGKDGTEVIVDSKEDSHLDDVLLEGQGPQDNNWLRYCGTTVAPYNLNFRNTFNIYGVTISFELTGHFGHVFNYVNNETSALSESTKGFGGYLKDALAMDASGYTAGHITPPLYNEKNYEQFNAGGLYSYTVNLYNKADWHWRNASSIRINSVYLGYALPAKVLRNSRIESFSIYGEVNNLGAIWVANDLGIDPYAVPGTLRPLINYTFGLKMTF